MTITIRPLHLYIAVFLLLLGFAGAAAYVSSRVNVAKAEQVKADVKEQIDALRADLRSQIATIEQDKKQVQTPQQIVVKMPEYVKLPSPPVVQQPPTFTEREQPEPVNTLPNAPSVGLYFPPEDVKPLFDRLADCKACDLKLAEAQKENTLITKRAEAAEVALRGGSFWRRLKSNAKWFVIGGAVGAGAVIAVRR